MKVFKGVLYLIWCAVSAYFYTSYAFNCIKDALNPITVAIAIFGFFGLLLLNFAIGKSFIDK